ncbi:MAG: energy-coupling factor transporter ATPase [Bacillota bacterium]
MARLIWVQGLSHRYGADTDHEILALDNVDLEIEAGEFVAIIGHNGSGKSTLAKHLNALLVPSQGKVVIDSLDTADEKNLWEIRRRAGMVFQNPDNQLVATTVEEDVAFGPENLGVEPSRIRERVEQALSAVGMSDFQEHAPHLLSGGQKQRVAIAGILAMRPICLIMDEATAMLDPAGRAEVLETVRRLNREEGITVLHITHYMEEAVGADRIVVMEAGRIVMTGTPAEVFQRVDELKAMGLSVPQAAELADRLRKRGVQVPPDVITVEELVGFLCR